MPCVSNHFSVSTSLEPENQIFPIHYIAVKLRHGKFGIFERLNLTQQDFCTTSITIAAAAMVREKKRESFPGNINFTILKIIEKGFHVIQFGCNESTSLGFS